MSYPQFKAYLLSIDIRGLWSTRQAQKVIERLQPEAEALGIVLGRIDVSTFSRPNRALIFSYDRN
jgi:hypothetical protein